jgi:hypothetical protein
MIAARFDYRIDPATESGKVAGTGLDERAGERMDFSHAT